MNKYIKTAIGIIISAFFLWIVLKDIDYAALWDVLFEFNWWILGLGLVLWLIGYGIRAWRWKVLIAPVKEISFRTSFEILVVGFTGNNLLPLRAGEIIRSILLGHKEHISKMTVFASIAAERLFDGIIILGLTILGASVLELPDWIVQTIWVSGLIFFTVLIGFIFLIFYNQQTMRLIGFFLKVIPEKFRGKVTDLLTVFTAGIGFLRDPKIMTKVLLSSLSIWLIEAGFYYIAAISFGFSITFIQTLFLKGILNLGILVPSAPGYVGTFEFFAIEALALIGIARTPALGYALVTHFVEFIAINILGVYYWIKYGLTLDQVSEEKISAE
ncbi:MAG: flippase-like domain-containing protein [Bacteroidetes bacterium]|nr:flippase-like domain-containing protein [Bacteroidota bacterium]